MSEDSATRGRKDWDYVEMADYQSDMRENADQAAAAISFLKSRGRAAEHKADVLMLALIDALKQLGPGAKASVYNGHIANLPKLPGEVVSEHELSTDCLQFRLGSEPIDAKRKRR